MQLKLLLLLFLSFFVGCFSGSKSMNANSRAVAVASSGSSTSSSSAVPTAPVLTSHSNKIFPSNEVDQDSAVSIDWNNTVTGSDVGMTYVCTFDTTIDGAVAAGTACTSLPSAAASTLIFDAATGILTWTPDRTAWRSYEIRVVGTSSSGSDSKIIVVAVRPLYTQTNLLADYDAWFADFTKQATAGACTSWRDLTVTGFDINSCGNGTWGGAGTYASPYNLTFAGGGGMTPATDPLTAQTTLMFSTWIAPTTPSTTGTVILSNQNATTGNGFVVRQSSTQSGRLEFQVGRNPYTYRDLILSDKPIGYWRLGEGAGATADDLSSFNRDGTYMNAPTLGQADALANDADTAVLFDGVNDSVLLANSSLVGTSPAGSIELWVSSSVVGFVGQDPIYSEDDGGGGTIFSIGRANDAIFFQAARNPTWTGIGSAALTWGAGIWHHIIVTWTATTIDMYVDGVAQPTVAANGATDGTPIKTQLGKFENPGYFLTGQIDDVSLYNYALTPTQAANHYKAGMQADDRPEMPPNRVLSDNPVGYWRLGETSGNIAYDSSSGNSHGTYQNNPTLGSTGAIASDSDKSVSLVAASTQGAVISSVANISMGAEPYTLEAWINPTTHAANTIVGHGNAGVNNQTNVFRLGAGNQIINYWWGNDLTANLGGSLVGGWHHVVATWNGITRAIYVDSVLVGSDTPAAPNVMFSSLHIGAFAGESFNGNIDEVATYDYALSQTQINEHYSGSSRRFEKCQTLSTFTATAWNLISGIWDGTTLSFFINGKKECEAQPTAATFTPSATFTVAATPAGTNAWSGAISDLKLYSSGTATSVKTNFDATADRYRESPVGGIVTSGLVLHLDAASAKEGLRPYANGCASTNLNWFDLSSTNLLGVLTGFSGCGAGSGWNGAGTAANPYRLTFDGANDYVELGNQVGPQTGLTYSAWINPSAAVTQVIISQLNETVNQAYSQFFLTATGQVYFRLFNATPAGPNLGRIAPAGTVTTGSWFHVAGTWNGGTSASDFKIYVNGTQVDTSDNIGGGAFTGPNATAIHLWVGAQEWSSAVTAPFAGAMSTAQIYSRELTQTEIRQNCNAQKARFQGAVCN